MKFPVISILCAVALFGCGEDDPVLATVSWETSCTEGSECNALLGARSINQFDGALGVEASCFITSVGTDQVSIRVDALEGGLSQGDGVAVLDLRVNEGTGAITGTSCEARVHNDGVPFGSDNTDPGVCGSAAPSSAQPCQVTGVVVDGSTVDLQMQCVGLKSAVTTERIDVAGPASGNATIHFENCTKS